MKLVTYNIRLDRGWDGKNNFPFRKPLILETIRREAPDVICFQEVLPHVAPWLRENLREYYLVGCPRGENLDDEQTCIAYRWDKFELLRMEVYWLSPTPEVPGSRYEQQSICPRVCTEAILRQLETGRVFCLSNTHLDHEGPQARLLAVRQILKRQAQRTCFPGIPALLVGDMNAEPDSEEMQLLSRQMRNETEGIGITFHGFGGGHPGTIDYIFTSGSIRCSSVTRWTDCRDGVYLSDHYPVCAQLELE